MTKRPIIFSAPMVRAILAGRKRQTRRLATSPLRKCEPGDLLWVREAWAHDAPDVQACRRALEDALAGGIGYGPYYRATETAPDTLRWRPPIHMPRWASRITLEVIGVKFERLQDISEEDAKAEGAIRYVPTQSTLAGQSLPPLEMWCFDVDPIEGARLADARRVRDSFELLWRKLHGHNSWEANPEVVAISFKPMTAQHRPTERSGNG